MVADYWCESDETAAESIAQVEAAGLIVLDPADEATRQVVSEVVTYHHRRTMQYCACGWGELGRSHSDHVADLILAALTTHPTPRTWMR